jgi:hypothetical protein
MYAQVQDSKEGEEEARNGNDVQADAGAKVHDFQGVLQALLGLTFDWLPYKQLLHGCTAKTRA